jgi:hypothetical protein
MSFRPFGEALGDGFEDSLGESAEDETEDTPQDELREHRIEPEPI